MPELKITSQVMRVLHAFIEARGSELTGANIHERTGMRSGTLYPILIRLREGGWLSDRWEDGEPFKLGRPKRRYYRLTAAGRLAYNRGRVKADAGEFAWAF